MRKLSYEKHQLLLNKKNNTIINEIIAKISSVFFIIITSFYPLFVGFKGYSSITINKAIFFWIVTGITTMLLLFMLVCIKEKFNMSNYYIENEPSRKITLTEWAIFGFIIWTFISSILSMLFNSEWTNRQLRSANVWWGVIGRNEGFITFLCYAITFIIITRSFIIKQLHLQLLAISAILVSNIGVLQFFGIDIFRLTSNDAPLSLNLRTTLGHVNIVSAYCAFMIMLFAALFTVSRSKWQYLYLIAGVCAFALSLTTGFSGDSHKIALFGSMILLIPYWFANRERLGRILIVLSSWCIVYTGHSAYMSTLKRQYEAGVSFSQYDSQLLRVYEDKNIYMLLIISTVLVVVGLGLLLLLKKWAEKSMKIIGILILPIIVISGLIGLEIIGSRLSNQPDNMIWQAREMIHGRVDDDFGTYRIWIWRNAVEIIPDNPIFGTGPDTFFHALGIERQVEAYERYGFIHDKAHNIFLQIAVCMGIPALVTYLIFLGSIFIPAMKRAFERPILFAFGAAALSYVIQSFFSIEGPIVMPLFWIALGVMANEVWQAKIGYISIEF